MSKTESDLKYIQNKLQINLEADLDPRASSFFTPLGWALFWRKNKK